jgi:hypothetical protein
VQIKDRGPDLRHGLVELVDRVLEALLHRRLDDPYARRARLAPAASSILVTSAGCPVLVDPPGWPPHRGWLHTDRHILAGAR